MEDNVKQIMEDVEKWLEANPEAPSEVVEWLHRPEDGGPEGRPPVNPMDKVRYMRSHAFVKDLVKQFTGPFEITKVTSIQEAIDISLKDIKKGSN